MRPKNSNPPITEDDQLFDLLVDGQLDEPRRRELLTGLDDRPGGWRRCALAFLEAQSWREAMDAFAHPRAAVPAAAPPQAAPRKRRSRRDLVTTLLGVAASFLLGIGITSWQHDMQQKGIPVGGGPSMAKVAADDAFGYPGSGQNVQWVSLSSKGADGRPHTVQLPAVARDRLDENWLRSLPSAIPEDLSRSLQQAGHGVQSSRQLIPFRLKDGRRLVVPVDQLDVRYVSNPEYQ